MSLLAYGRRCCFAGLTSRKVNTHLNYPLKRASLLAAGAIAAMLMGTTTAANAQTVLENFTGNFYGGASAAPTYNGYTPTNYDGFIPPDTMGAAGNGDFVQIINGGYTVYGSNGAILNASGTTDSKFWTAAGIDSTTANSVADPHILFDPNSNRWYASEITFPGGTISPNQFLVAVSKSANPLDGFTGYSYNANPAANSGNLFADYDMLGINSQGVYVGANMFNTAGNYTSQDVLTVSKAGLLSGGASNPTSTLTYNASATAYGFGGYPVVDQDNGGTASNLGEYVLGVGTANNNSAKVDTLSGTAGSAVLANNGTVTFTSANALAGFAHQPGGNNTIDTGDNRFSGAVVKQSGIIYSANTLADKTTGLADIHILGINAATNALVIDQIISGTGKGTGGTNLDLYYPSLAINAAGNVVIGYSGSGSNDYASAYIVAGKLAANGASIAFGNAIKTAAGQGNYNVDYGSGRNRFGDYSATTVDPTNPNNFWTVQEFAIGTNQWGTQITEIGMASAAPEPAGWATLLLIAGGIAGLCLRAGKRRQENAAAA